MTKKQNVMYENYKRATATKLSDVYSSFSRAKMRVYEWCCRQYIMMNGRQPRITSANTYSFTFAFQYLKDGKNWLHVETSKNTYDFEIE